jgi:hypothetical protein
MAAGSYFCFHDFNDGIAFGNVLLKTSHQLFGAAGFCGFTFSKKKMPRSTIIKSDPIANRLAMFPYE